MRRGLRQTILLVRLAGEAGLMVRNVLVIKLGFSTLQNKLLGDFYERMATGI